MAVAGRAYVVREDSAAREDSEAAESGKVDRLYPYSLKGLTDALEEARLLSFSGAPQVVAVAAESGIKVIRKYAHGREVPGDDPPGLALQAFQDESHAWPPPAHMVMRPAVLPRRPSGLVAI